ncbi:MAG: 4Fe-4S dicluster domain-containing protein [Candidatus Lokiarchaeota archaeon]|nr:4Fe-4S dicluster domain-containing protein [Candidatus Lokiarchaeota archaeon]
MNSTNTSDIPKLDQKIDDFTQNLPESLRNALYQCISCGKCVAACTAARVSDFNSRLIVAKVIDKDESVLTDEMLWKCFLCHQCAMLCPKKDMDLPDLIYRLRQISIQKGVAPLSLKKLDNWLYRFFESGKIAGPNSVSEERTERLKKVAEISGVNVYKQCIEELENADEIEDAEEKG